MRTLLEVIGLVALISMYAVVAGNWSDLPDRVPTHFSGAGVPDDWGPKSSILLVPIIATALYLILTAISQADIHYSVPFRLDQSDPVVRREVRVMLIMVKVVIAMTMAFLSWRSVQVALGEASGLDSAFLPILLGSLAAVIGSSMLRLQRLKRSVG